MSEKDGFNVGDLVDVTGSDLYGKIIQKPDDVHVQIKLGNGNFVWTTIHKIVHTDVHAFYKSWESQS